jgi:hypothetical protein
MIPAQPSTTDANDNAQPMRNVYVGNQFREVPEYLVMHKHRESNQ